jgi:hypothetical protein
MEGPVKRATVIVLVALALSCKDSTSPKPLDPWVGTWQLVSVDSVAVPANVKILGVATLVVKRTLDVWSGGQGIWRDSTLSASTCGDRSPIPMCDDGGIAGFTWTTLGDTLTFRSLFATTVGYVVAVKTFVKQADSTLLKTDDNQTEVYRR